MRPNAGQNYAAQNASDHIRKAQEGSREAMGKLMESCQRYLMLVANREINGSLRSKGGASDIVQETFLEAQRDFARFDGQSEEELRAWLRRLLINNVQNFSRRYRQTGKRQVDLEVSLDGPRPDDRPGRYEIRSPVDSPSACMMANEQTQSLFDALDRLPEHYREIILMHHREGLSYGQIAERLNRTPEAVRKLWTRAIEKLQEELEPPHERD